MIPDPWSLLPKHAEGLCSESKELLAFEIPHEVVLIPARAKRAGIPGEGRAVLGPAKGLLIREDEILWRDDEVVLTTNRFPFFEQQGILWPVHGHPREPSVRFLSRCLEIAGIADASLLLNGIGASASIPLCHVHLCPKKSKALPLVAMKVLAEMDGLSCLGTDPDGGYPCFLAVVRGADALRRARMIVDLLTVRLTLPTTSSHRMILCGSFHALPRSCRSSRPQR